MRRIAAAPLKTALLAACLALAPAWALAGKPGSGPQVLTGTGGYVAQPLFDSIQALPVIQGEYAYNPVSGSTSMEYAENLSLLRGVEVDDLGAVYSIFHANEAVTGGSNTFTGIVRYNDADGIEVVLARSYFYDGQDVESAQGEYIGLMDRVPALAPSATGDIESGDFVVWRWTDTTDASDPSSPLTDDRNEIVLFRPDTSGQLVEEQVLYSFDGLANLSGIQLAADCFGSVYLWLTTAATAGAYDTGLYRLAYDASGPSYGLTRLTFPFETNQYFDTDDAGNLYVQGAFGGSNQGVIYRLSAGGDPHDSTAYATYTHGFGAWTADNADITGTLAMFLRRSSPQLNYVGHLAQGDDVAYADRIAESESSGVYAMTADALGSVYLAHEDRSQVSKSQYAVAAYTIYRLDPDASGGGGDTGGGGGKGNGKDK